MRIDEWGIRRPARFALIAAVTNTAIFALMILPYDAPHAWWFGAIFLGTLGAAYAGRRRAARRQGSPSLYDDVKRLWRSMN